MTEPITCLREGRGSQAPGGGGVWGGATLYAQAPSQWGREEFPFPPVLPAPPPPTPSSPLFPLKKKMNRPWWLALEWVLIVQQESGRRGGQYQSHVCHAWVC